MQPAAALGRRAVALKMETLDMARIHRRALLRLQSLGDGDKAAKLAAVFFSEAIVPIEQTHRAALKSNARLSHLTARLGRRTALLKASNRSLKQRIVQRKTIQVSLTKSAAHFEKLLKESQSLQARLQRLTHRIMTAQENKRRRISNHLQNEIAQILLGINVRLLALRREAILSTQELQSEILRTRRLVDSSMESIRRFARDLGRQNET